jgi:hypothetical protein
VDDNPFTPEPNDGWNNVTSKAAIAEQISRGRRIYFLSASEININSDLMDAGYQYLSTAFPNIPANVNFTNIGLKYSPQYKDYIAGTKAAIISSHVGDAAANASAMVRFRNEIPSLKSAYMLFRKDENPRLEEDIFKSIVKGINGIYFWDPADTGIGTDHYTGEYGDIIARVGGYLAQIKPGLVAPNRDYKPDYMIALD